MTSLFGGGSSINVNASGTLVPQTLTPTAGQTVFTLTSFTYTVGTSSLLVWVNGIKQILGIDFTETSTTSFTLLTPLTVDDVVEVIGFPLASFFQAGVGTNLTDIPTVGIVQAGLYFWGGTAGGSANALTVTTAPVPAALAAGQVIRFIAALANSGASTLKNGTLATTNLKKISSSGLADLAAGDIIAGGIYQAAFDGTQFQLTSGAGGGNTFAQSNLNVIINGGMQVAQRAATYTITNSPSYGSLDRFFAYQGTAAAGVFNQDSSTLPTGFRFAAKLGRNATSTGVTPIFFGQIIETANCVDLQGKVVTLSFYAQAGANFSAAGSTIQVRIGTGTGTDQSSSAFIGGWTGAVTALNVSQVITTTWTRYSFTVTLAANITQVGFDISYTPTGTAGTFDAVYITGVQLEVGSVATAFEQRPYGMELALCQRYYEIDSGYLVYGVPSTYFSFGYKVTKRVVPTIVLSAGVVNGSTTGGFNASNGSISNTSFTASAEL